MCIRDSPYLHPGRKADILYDGTVVGFLGEVQMCIRDSNKAKGGEKLVSEYTVQDQALPRHVKFESMPADMPQMTAAWFYRCV